MFDEFNNQGYRRQGTLVPPTNEAGDSARIPLQEKRFTDSQPIRTQEAEEEETGEFYLNEQLGATPEVPDDDTEMEDTIVLRAPHLRPGTELQESPAT